MPMPPTDPTGPGTSRTSGQPSHLGHWHKRSLIWPHFPRHSSLTRYLPGWCAYSPSGDGATGNHQRQYGTHKRSGGASRGRWATLDREGEGGACDLKGSVQQATLLDGDDHRRHLCCTCALRTYKTQWHSRSWRGEVESIARLWRASPW